MTKRPTPEHYQRRVGGVLLDPYRIARVYGMADDALFSALKKILAAGRRGAKDTAHDVQDAIDALVRWQEMEREDSTPAPMTAALDAVDMAGPMPVAYCPGAHGHTCDGGRLVECDEHGETDAGPCPRCNPPPPQTYRDRIAELEHKLAAQQMSYESQQIDHLARIAELERELEQSEARADARLRNMESARNRIAELERERDEYRRLYEAEAAAGKALSETHTRATADCIATTDEADAERDHWRQTAERAQADLDALRQTLDTERQAAAATAEELERVREAVLWALGEKGEFRLRGEKEGAYWWRSELRRRAFHEPPAPEGE